MNVMSWLHYVFSTGCFCAHYIKHIATISHLYFLLGINKVFLYFNLSYLSIAFFFLSCLIPDSVYSVVFKWINMTFKFKRSYWSLVELRPHGNRLRLKWRKVPRTMYARGRLARLCHRIINIFTYRQGNNPYMDTAFN